MLNDGYCKSFKNIVFCCSEMYEEELGSGDIELGGDNLEYQGIDEEPGTYTYVKLQGHKNFI